MKLNLGLVKNLLISLLISSLVAPFMEPFLVQAQITDCDAQVSPNQVDSGSTNSFTIVVTNGSAERIRWLKFTRPSNNFTLNGVTASGWTTVSTDSVAIVVNGNTINTPFSKTFTLTNVVAANVNAPSVNWSIEAADNASGSDPYTCTGTLGTQIGTPDTTAPVISNIAVSNITNSVATVTWSTDEPSSSRVNYGLTASYGSNVSSATLTTSHSVTLTNLSSSSGYHFQVVSSDASSNTASSADNTFLTQALSQTSQKVSDSATNQSTSTTQSGDTVLPVVTLQADFSKIYKSPPTILGQASDNTKITKIEYSTDGGDNWLPVEAKIEGNQRIVNFSFKPIGLPDGNYEVLARAYDDTNIGYSEKGVLIIDLLAPKIGPNVVTYGSQYAVSKNNLIFAVVGVDQKITLSSIGGPTSINIKASSKDDKETKFFSLTKIRGSNLWSGILAFEKEGSYTLLATAVDGANNKITRELNDVYVARTSAVVDRDNRPINDATVSVYYYEPGSQVWSLWDGAAFGQENPQISSKGMINFFLPAGKYYIRAESAGHAGEKSQIFSLAEGQPLSAKIVLNKASEVKLGSFKIILPALSLGEITINTENTIPVGQYSDKLKSKDLPKFQLPNSQREMVESNSLSGKITLLTFLSTWGPNTAEQIAQMNSLSQATQSNLFVVVPLESFEKVAAFKSLGNYNVEFLIDEDGSLIDNFDILSTPTHVFVKNDLVVGEVNTNLLSKEELQEALEKL